jgi:hypothetical protein
MTTLRSWGPGGILAIALLGAGCASASPAKSPDAGSDSVATALASIQTRPDAANSVSTTSSAGPQLDRTIAPLSISKPPGDASRAFEVCSVEQWVDRKGLGVVAGIGRIDRASDAPHYARLSGREPEIHSEKPAWIVQFSGDIRMPWSNQIYVDPACIVVEGGEGGFFATGGVRELGSDEVREAPSDAIQPDRALPPPVP